MSLIDQMTDWLNLSEKFVKTKPPEALSRKLDAAQPRGLLVGKLSEGEYSFTAKFTFTPGGGTSIEWIATLTESPSGGTTIDLTTKPQFSVWFSAIMVLAFLIALPFIKEPVPIWIILLVVVMPLCFFFVLRVQEKKLFRRMKEFLNQL